MGVANIVRSWIGEVYLASCVRTPLGRMNGALKEVTEARLGAIVIDSVLQRSAIDKKSVDQAMMGSRDNVLTDMMSYAGLPDTANYSTLRGFNGLTSIASAIDLLTKGLNVTIIGGTSIWCDEEYEQNLKLLRNVNGRSIDTSQEYARARMKYLEAKKNELFLEEIEPIKIPGHPRLNRPPVNLSEDEIDDTINNDSGNIRHNSIMTTGAAACTLVSKDFINKINISPLVKILSMVEVSPSGLSPTSFLEENKLGTSDISLWQINARTFDQYERTVSQIGIDEALVNIHGGSSAIGHGTGMNGLFDLIHMSYSLKAHQKGVIIQNDGESAMAILVEKLPVNPIFISPQNKPKLTLFTKDPCPLCEELKLELAPYLERVHLEEVHISPESYWYKLYRYEIPVLFLGGRYVCRNKFDIQVFEKILRNLEVEIYH